MQQFYLLIRAICLSCELFNSILIVILLTLFVQPAFSGGMDQFKIFISQVHTAKGNFTQEIVRSSSTDKKEQDTKNIEEISSGTFIFSRPGKFIWSYKKPYQEVLQSDGNILYIYDHDLNQVIKYRLSQSPASILFGNENFEKNYILSDEKENEGVYWLNMLPKRKEYIQFKKIVIGFKNNIIQSMKLYDLFGNLTLIIFTNIQINPKLNNHQFKFTLTKDTDVIEG